jgi:pancreatic triacylglycerol lipase
MNKFYLEVLLFYSTLFYISGISAFNAETDVRLQLWTRRNLEAPELLQWDDFESVRNSSYGRWKPTTFLIHGFIDDGTGFTGLDETTVKAILAKYDYNVIFVDWSAGTSTFSYARARRRIRDVAPVVARFIELLNVNRFLNFRLLEIVGFNLGAHTAGLIGKNVTGGKVHKIVGLDPSGPLFDLNNVAERLDAGDAEYVECIHTNGAFFTGILIPGYGIGEAIGHADFFPNGGNSQPGCFSNTCAHLRAVALFNDSLLNGNLWANQCESTRRMNRTRCLGEPGAFMGDPFNYRQNVRVIFFLETNSRAPFGQGVWESSDFKN